MDLTLLPFILAFVAGFIVKCVDWLDDDRKSRHPVKYALAVAYGILIGYIIGASTFSVLFVAALVAQVFAKKVDTVAHRIGFMATAIAMLAFGFPFMDAVQFGFFLLLAFLDEADYVGRLRPLAEYRPFLPAGALCMLVFGRWDYFAGIALFDIGYKLFPALQKHIK
jgi:hypothetical protein